MDGDQVETKFVNEVKCISHVEIKEEIIIPENTSDSESTLSDNDKSSDLKFEECTICCKYRSMFIILKNHECQPTETDGKCIFCNEISHWLNCFKSHKDSHELERDHSSDSTTSDREENEEKCEICLKYEFMVPLLKSHVCNTSDQKNIKCSDCKEASHWAACYKKHKETHETKDNVITVKEEDSSDSTASDNEEIQKVLCHVGSDGHCFICLKYEVMLIILEENHFCKKGVNKKCDKCDEIIQWCNCFESHKKTHDKVGKVVIDNKKINKLLSVDGKFDCGICLKLNSIVTNLVKNHTCDNDRSCMVCNEVSYWLWCLKNHKRSETKSDLSDASDGEELESVKISWKQTECAVCSKFRSAIANLKDHVCRRKRGSQKCEICLEFSFWSKNLKLHENHHLKQPLPLKNFLSCSNCGKRFSSEKMLNVHKSYCRSSDLTCELCDKRFLNMFSLKKHTIFQSCRNSTITVQQACKICKKTFSNTLDLKNHEKFHEDSNSFKCTECFSEFKSEFCLKKHKRIHR